MSVYIIDKCERFVSQRAGCGKAASPDSVRGVRPQGVRLLDLGFGVYMEVLADVVMLPGESFVRAIVLTWRTNFGTTKICFDVSMAVIAAVLSFVFTGHLNGVREGTIIAALLVGFVARVLGKKLASV